VAARQILEQLKENSGKSIKKKCRNQRSVCWIENLVQDVLYGARTLRKRPGFTAVTVLTLAFAIGAAIAIVSVVKTSVLDPLPCAIRRLPTPTAEKGEAEMSSPTRAVDGYLE